VPVVKDEAGRLHQRCGRNLGFAAGRVPQPHTERRDSGRGFSSQPTTPAPQTAQTSASRHLSRCARNEEERLRLIGRPCHIVLYQKNIEAVCSNEAEVRHQIRQTLIHELGHYFGMTEEQLKDV
jgi:hypothetical protein